MSANQPSRSATSKPPPPPIVRIESHYRKFLARRWLALTFRAAIWTSAVSCALGLHSHGFQSSAIIPSLLAGLAAFPLLVYPILWIRRSMIVSPLRLAPSPALITTISSILTTGRCLRFIAVYAWSGAGFAVLYGLLANSAADFGFWTSTQRHPWHLNERLIFLILGSSIFHVLLALRELFGDRIKPVWPMRRTPFSKAVKNELVQHLSIWEFFVNRWNSVTIAFVWALVYTSSYMATRITVWRFIINYTGSLLRPFILNFMKNSRTNVTVSLAWHLLLAELLALTVTKIPMAAMMAYITQPLNFDTFTRKSPLGPDRYLLTALDTQNQYYLHFTLMELLRVSHLPNRRKAIFTDISKTPTLTAELWQELLVHLGRIHHNLVTRGGYRIASASSAARPSSAPDPRSIPVRSADIFRPATKPQSSLQLALKNVLDGPVRAPPQPVLKVQQLGRMAQVEAGKKAEEVQKQVMGRIEATPVGATVLSEAKGWNKAMWSWVGEQWVTRTVQRSLPEVLLAKRIIEILATLAVASIEEDTYGQVQNLLPGTLEAIIRFRSAIVSLGSEMLGQANMMGSAGPTASTRAQASLDSAISICDDGVKKIAEGFGSSLAAFKFPPSIAVELSEICRVEEK